MIETNCRIITELAEDITRAVQFKNVSREYLLNQVLEIVKNARSIRREVKKNFKKGEQNEKK